MQARVFITGAAGQLGRDLVRVLSPEHDLLAADLAPGSNGVVAWDITDWNQVKETVKSFKPRYIINTAAMTDVDGNEKEPKRAHLINTKGVEYLLTAADQIGARLVQISTDYVFDGTAGPYLESDAPAPLNVYGRTKLAAEGLVLEHDRHLVVRANVLFSADINAPASFVRWVVHSLRAGETIRVVDDQINNPTLTIHLAEALRRALELESAGLYHYGGLEFVSRFEFARIIARHFKLGTADIQPISTKELDQLAARPLKSGLICSKIKMDLDVTNANLSEALSQAFPVS